MKTILIDKNKKGKPNIKLTVQRVEPEVWYDLGFYKHHYLTSKLNKACKCLLFSWDDNPVAFVGIINTPRNNIPYGMSISRIVILPDYQGMGLSTTICNFCGGLVKSLGNEYRLYIKTIHELMGNYFSHSDKWKPTTYNGKTRDSKFFVTESGKYNNRFIRSSYCYEYIGEKIDGYQDIFKPISEMRRLKKVNGIV